MKRFIHPGCSFASMLLVSVLICMGSAWAGPYSPVSARSWEWQNPLPQGNSIRRVDFINGRFFSLGRPLANMTSAKGVEWQPLSVPRYTRYGVICKGKGKLIMMEYYDGFIYSSVNGGKTWKKEGKGPECISDMIFVNDLFVAVGHKEQIYHSTDGINWTPGQGLTSPSEFDLNSVAYGNNQYVAVGTASFGDGIMYTSADGKNWTRLGLRHSFTTVFFDGKKFISSSSKVLWESTDGTNWKETAGPAYGLEKIVYRNGLYVAVTYDGIHTSTDTVTWKRRLNTTPLHGLAYGNGTYVAAGEKGEIYTSPDGIKWTSRLVGKGNTYAAVAHGDSGYVSVSSNAILFSPDGEKWEKIRAGAFKPGYIVSPLPNSVAYGNGRYVVGALMWPKGQNYKQTYVYMVSENGLDWTVKQHPDKCLFFSITYGNSTFVASGYGMNYRAYLYTSQDGVSWKRGLETDGPITRISYSQGTFMGALGSTFLFSKDGLKWKQQEIGGDRTYSGITFDGKTYVAVSAEDGSIHSSADGVNWEVRHKPEGWSSVDYPVITWGGGMFLASMGLYAVGNHFNHIYVSLDGVTWKEIYLYLDSEICGATFAEEKFTLVGSNGMVLQSQTLE